MSNIFAIIVFAIVAILIIWLLYKEKYKIPSIQLQSLNIPNVDQRLYK